MDDISFNAYHGSVEWKAQQIERNGFIISSKNCEWLVEGIYFFEKKDHAVVWAKRECEKPKNIGHNPAVVCVTIKCTTGEYLDLDDEKNMSDLISCFYNAFKDSKKGRPQFDNDYQLRCFCCNLFRRMNPQYKVLAYTFGFPPKRNMAGFHVIKQEKQYCVVSNDYVFERKVEVYDNAI